MSAGGKRKGAGRPPLLPHQKPVGVTVRIPREVAEKFAAWCKARGMSQAEAFATWVRHLREP